MEKIKWFTLLVSLTTFSQAPGNGVTDVDGNQYNSVIIGTQEWMKENLNVSKYSDGTIIPQVTDSAQWANLTTGAWCYYNNDAGNGAIYGKLYNWYAVAGIHDNDPNTPNKLIAPQGWHIPNNAEWNTLQNFLDPNASGGMNNNLAGGKMKSTGTSLWNSPNTAATNESGFTGLPGGSRSSNSIFSNVGNNGVWWSLFSNESIFNLSLNYISNAAIITYNFNSYKLGYSVRCINDITLNNNSFNDSSFRIYPNPAKDFVNIDISNLSNINGLSYKIINTLGQKVQMGLLSSQQNLVQLNNIKEHGVYFVKIYDSLNNLLDTKKIIIQQ